MDKTERIINLGKIPLKYKFQYKRTLQNAMINNDFKEHAKIVEKIEKDMRIFDKIENYDPDKWKFTIDDNYNFWLMTKEYINEHFIDKEDN